jgi:hypothetical protein
MSLPRPDAVRLAANAQALFDLIDRVASEAVGDGNGAYAIDVDLFNEIGDIVLDLRKSPDSL